MRSKNSEFGQFAVLLVTLLMYICMLPFISEWRLGHVTLRYGTSLLLLAAVYSVSTRYWQLAIAFVLALPAMIVQLIPTLLGERETLLFRMGASAVFLTYIIILLSIFLLKQNRVSADMVLGAVNIYLLLAITFTFLNAFAEIVEPGSYLYQGDSLTAVLSGHPEIQSLAFLLYFSLVTVTTLGYGDIAPAMPAARMLCSLEAVIGQLFVAVFIARMVAIHIGERSR